MTASGIGFSPRIADAAEQTPLARIEIRARVQGAAIVPQTRSPGRQICS